MPINITMPALSPTMTDGTLAKWLKKEGDKVKAGDVIAEIETDKATMEVEAVDEGILGKILVAAGTEKVAVNDVIAILLEEGESASVIGSPAMTNSLISKPSQEPVKKDIMEVKPMTATAQPVAVATVPASGARVFATPLARRIATQKGINLSTVSGSGPHGRIVKADLDKAPAATQAPRASSAPSASGIDAKKQADLLGMKYTEVPNNNVKKITAQRLLESKVTVPHFYLTIECVIDQLLEARRDINEKSDGKYKLSVNDFIIKAVAMALKAYPAANVAWTDAAVLQYEHADISVAVATPNGLITPIIKAAETKGLAQISSEMKDLAARARDGKLKPTEFQGGTFSISNLGMYGIKEFAAIINPPQACILAVGAGIEKPVVEKGEIKIRNVMTCTLSTDHRAVDGAVGAEFLQIFKRYVENPVSILL